MPVWNFVRKSVYQDSVTLMRLSRELEAVPGVRRAAAMMGTPQNRALLKDAGLLAPDGEAASPNDLSCLRMPSTFTGALLAGAGAALAFAAFFGAFLSTVFFTIVFVAIVHTPKVAGPNL